MSCFHDHRKCCLLFNADVFIDIFGQHYMKSVFKYNSRNKRKGFFSLQTDGHQATVDEKSSLFKSFLWHTCLYFFKQSNAPGLRDYQKAGNH